MPTDWSGAIHAPVDLVARECIRFTLQVRLQQLAVTSYPQDTDDGNP